MDVSGHAGVGRIASMWSACRRASLAALNAVEKTGRRASIATRRLSRATNLFFFIVNLTEIALEIKINVLMKSALLYSNFLEQEEEECKLKTALRTLFKTVYNRLNKYRGNAAASFFRY